MLMIPSEQKSIERNCFSSRHRNPGASQTELPQVVEALEGGVEAITLSRTNCALKWSRGTFASPPLCGGGMGVGGSGGPTIHPPPPSGRRGGL